MADFDETMRRHGRALRKESDARLDIDADLETVLARGTPSGATPGTSTQKTKRLAIAASLVAVLGLGAVALFLLGEARGQSTIAPTATATRAPQPPDSVPAAPHTDLPESTPSEVPASTVAAPPSTVAAPPSTVLLATGCLAGLTPLDAAQRYADLFAGSRFVGDFDVVAHCSTQLPAGYDTDGVICWNTCASPARLTGPFTTWESFDQDIDETFVLTAVPVQYFDDTTATMIDVIESWRLTRLDDGTYEVGDFRIESPIVERDASGETIRTYLGHIEAGRWDDAADMLDDGAIDQDQRADLVRLAPDDFGRDSVAAALQEWCAGGCDTAPFTVADLDFADDNYSLTRRGERITAAWFEGRYSISGLPVRTGPPIEFAEFSERAAEILADGTVERDEYLEAIEFLVDCANSRGADIDRDLGSADPSGTLVSLSVTGESSEGYNACYPVVQQVDVSYQTDDATRARIDTFYEAVLECLESSGIDVDGAAQAVIDDETEAFTDSPLEPRTLTDLDVESLVTYAGFEVLRGEPEFIRAFLICNPLPR